MFNDKKVNIKYLGKTGLTKDCVQDFSYLLQFYEKPKRIFVLTVPGSYEEMGVHMLMCLMDNTDPEKNRDFVFIKSGFTSGYEGEGPAGLSKVIEISEEMEIPISELFLKSSFFQKIESCTVSEDDFFRNLLDNTIHDKNTRSSHYLSYIKKDLNPYYSQSIWKLTYPIIPFAVLDKRVLEYAYNFFKDPDGNLLKIARRLETEIKKKAEEGGGSYSSVTGSTLYKTIIFPGEGKIPVLFWNGIDRSTASSRSKLFEGVFGAYRNERVHKEKDIYSFEEEAEFLRELFLLNELFILESKLLLNTEKQVY